MRHTQVPEYTASTYDTLREKWKNFVMHKGVTDIPILFPRPRINQIHNNNKAWDIKYTSADYAETAEEVNTVIAVNGYISEFKLETEEATWSEGVLSKLYSPFGQSNVPDLFSFVNIDGYWVLYVTLMNCDISVIFPSPLTSPNLVQMKESYIFCRTFDINYAIVPRDHFGYDMNGGFMWYVFTNLLYKQYRSPFLNVESNEFKGSVPLYAMALKSTNSSQ